MTIKEIRSTRVANEISGSLLASKAGMSRSRLSHLEQGHVQPREDELQRLENTLKGLVEAKAVVITAAASVGLSAANVF